MASVATHAPAAAVDRRAGDLPATGRLAAVMPCHRTLPSRGLLEELRRWIPDVLVVADGMPPKAVGQLVDRVESARVELLRFAYNRGKGHAVQAGIRHLLARSPAPEGVMVLDSDGQHPRQRFHDSSAPRRSRI